MIQVERVILKLIGYGEEGWHNDIVAKYHSHGTAWWPIWATHHSKGTARWSITATHHSQGTSAASAASATHAPGAGAAPPAGGVAPAPSVWVAEAALAAAVPCEWCVAVIGYQAVPCEWYFATLSLYDPSSPYPTDFKITLSSWIIVHILSTLMCILSVYLTVALSSHWSQLYLIPLCFESMRIFSEPLCVAL